MLAREVVAVDVSKVVRVWDLIVLDVLGVSVFLLPHLSLLKSTLELSVAHVTKSSSSGAGIGLDKLFVGDLSQTEGVLVAFLSVEGMSFLVLAGVCLPANIHAVDL